MSDEGKSTSPLRLPAAVVINRAMCYVAILIITAVIFYASFFPRPLVLPMINTLLSACAVAVATLAMLRGQSLMARHLTFWDVAAVFLFIALGAGMISDPEMAKAYLQEVGAPETPVPPT